MQRDLRNTPLYAEAEALHRAIRRPGTGLISDAADVSTNGKYAAFAATLVESLSGLPPTRICSTDLATGDTRVLTFGPGSDHQPQFGPDGRQIAFLSDRLSAGNFQLYLLDSFTGAARSTPTVEGWVEYLRWSPDGTRILLGVAGHGADVSGGQGAIASDRGTTAMPSWMPLVESGDEAFRWRSVWVYELATNRIKRVSRDGLNVWEAVWCGDRNVAAVVSPGPSEGLWYSATLQVLDLGTGESRELYVPQDQLGWPAATASGKCMAIVEALCSDRWFVAGDLKLIEPGSGRVRRVDTQGVDITYTEWRSEHELLVAGHRGFETVVGLVDAASETFVEVWSSHELTAGGFFASVAGCGAPGDSVLIARGFARAPEIGVIRGGEYFTVRSFDAGYSDEARVVRAIERFTWRAPDGLELQGWLLRPAGDGPHPLIMNIHGGPLWHWRPAALGVPLLMLLKRGYAIFFPNPRGSTGRGQEFARRVLGDMGGADTYDYLSGLDELVRQGIADPRRLGVTGGSYGGFMTSWLITQDARFAAALALAPVTNHVTQHLTSNIPHFVKMFLADTYTNSTGKYTTRSPVMYAHRAKTPILNISGGLDRCTPPTEAVQFHNALLENGVESVLAIYPEEGHGVRKYPAAIDYAARVVAWFEEHIGTGTKPAAR